MVSIFTASNVLHREIFVGLRIAPAVVTTPRLPSHMSPLSAPIFASSALHCCLAIAASRLLPRYCCLATAASQRPLRNSCRARTAASQPLHRNCCIAAAASQLLPRNCCFTTADITVVNSYVSSCRELFMLACIRSLLLWLFRRPRRLSSPDVAGFSF